MGIHEKEITKQLMTLFKKVEQLFKIYYYLQQEMEMSLQILVVRMYEDYVRVTPDILVITKCQKVRKTSHKLGEAVPPKNVIFLFFHTQIKN